MPGYGLTRTRRGQVPAVRLCGGQGLRKARRAGGNKKKPAFYYASPIRKN